MIGRVLAWLAQILAAIVPAFIKEWRKPRETHYAGRDEEVEERIDRNIRDGLK